MKKPDQLQSYIKLLLVIESCTNLFHIIGAHNMTRQYRVIYNLHFDEITIVTLRVLLSTKQDHFHKHDKISKNK